MQQVIITHIFRSNYLVEIKLLILSCKFLFMPCGYSIYKLMNGQCLTLCMVIVVHYVVGFIYEIFRLKENKNFCA